MAPMGHCWYRGTAGVGITTHTGIELVQASTVSVGHHSWYRDLWMGQGCAAGMETANKLRNTARIGTQLQWGHMQGDSVEPWDIVMLQDKG